MYDLIGDIHGHADALVRLLETLGYRERDGVFEHPNRRVIFLGDFIDRGPRIRDVLKIAQPMVESGRALGVMGNHELNALAYHTPDPDKPGEHLRRHSEKNARQHAATINQLSPAELDEALKWFRTLPLWLEVDGLRAIHACWDPQSLKRVEAGLAGAGGITPGFLHAACREGGDLFHPVEVLLKGKEAELPDGVCFTDKDGTVRRSIRTRWYLSPKGHTVGTYALQSAAINCDDELPRTVFDETDPYPENAKPVFVGHYWLSASRPELLAGNVACLDYSVAKDGFLCAYRWDGEALLDNDHFVWVTP